MRPDRLNTCPTVKLNDKYTQEHGVIYLSGIQALVRLPLDQMRRDRRAGLNTGAFISGYEGSPLGGYDLALSRIKPLLAEHRIHFVPAVNEDIAATSILGSQIFETMGQPQVEGVVGIWYGKGPGVDRSGDILRHANLVGSPGQCAALVLAGDDHTSKSSTIPHQSDFSLFNVAIPTLYPGNTQEILDYGLLGIALSRHSGAWAGMKMVTNVCDGGGTVAIDAGRLDIRVPEGYQKKNDARLVPPFSLALEVETNGRRLEAARLFARLNELNRWHGARDGAWLGIATAGKPYYDLMQALRDFGVHDRLDSLGVRVAKFGMTYPLESRFVEDFARGLETILVIEEKRSFLELQIREALYNASHRPLVIGKEDERGAPLLPAWGELDPDAVAVVVGPRILARRPSVEIEHRLRLIEEQKQRPREHGGTRMPNFCSGCPHNRSTLLLEGQVGGGGTGCHGMAILLADAGRAYTFTTHMGGEGAPWIGMSPFTGRNHVFQNLGDGTYFHSGSLAVQAAVAAGVNITYKILYNGHVAMTGGQDATGALAVPELTRKLEAEGVKKTVVLVEDVARYPDRTHFGANAEVRDRFDLTTVLRELEQVPGVTALIYDQECAAEKRRQRSRGTMEEPTLRLMINEEVCEGCGDCVVQSNCMSLHPIETELGQKMRIHQSSCNKDYTCAMGDCPSFVTVKIRPGTGLRKRKLAQLPAAEAPPSPDIVKIGADGYHVLSPGIGGTGVVTINALLATAAVLDGLAVITLDQTGLAQKGGAVVSHLILSREPIAASAKINIGNADLILGFDLLGVAAADNLRSMHPERTVAVVNSDLTPTSDSIRRRAVLTGPEEKLLLINSATRRERNIFLDATRLAEGLFGSHLAVNVFLLGAAYQGGLIPISEKSIADAVRLNGVEIDRNLQAFLWGRKYYENAAWVEERLAPAADRLEERTDLVERRTADLAEYQDKAYARHYLDFVRRVEEQRPELKETVARNLYKLMAYKDEYEVARLLTKPEFEKRTNETWEAVQSIGYNLHPPLLRAYGLKRKIKLGAWFRRPLQLLAACRLLRGSPLDVFGYAAHRREDRALIGWYRKLIEKLLEHATSENMPLALEIAALPDQIRGYDHIRTASVAAVKKQADEKLSTLLIQAVTAAAAPSASRA